MSIQAIQLHVRWTINFYQFKRRVCLFIIFCLLSHIWYCSDANESYSVLTVP